MYTYTTDIKQVLEFLRRRKKAHLSALFLTSGNQLKYLMNLRPASLGRITDTLFLPQKGSKSVLS